MIKLELSQSSAEVLHETLESYLSELRFEIANTDRKSFRDHLKGKKAVLVTVDEQLREQLAAYESTGTGVPH